MIYEIENEYMKVSVDVIGAELKSVLRKDGNIEHLWQGDEKYWTSRSPILFPIVGRLFEGRYSFNGKEYEMNPHGLLRKSKFALVDKTCKKMTFAYSANDDTFARYPFKFIFTVEYSLCKNTLSVVYSVKNVGKDTMYFGLGGHPGFNVPFDGVHTIGRDKYDFTPFKKPLIVFDRNEYRVFIAIDYLPEVVFFFGERIGLDEFLIVYRNYLRNIEKIRNFVHIKGLFFHSSALLLYFRVYYIIGRKILQ